MEWVRKKLREWLGVEELERHADGVEKYARSVEKMITESQRVAIDFCGYSKGDTTIVVASQLNDGMVRVIHTSFGSIREFRDFMESRFPGFEENRRRGGRDRIIWDGPYGSRDAFFEGR